MGERGGVQSDRGLQCGCRSCCLDLKGKFGVNLLRERQEIKNVFNLSFLFKLCLLYLFDMGRGV